jgi:phosphatidylglycerophosphate synthase
VIGDSWTHLLARQLVRPLLGTPVRPNHLTTLRLVTGIGACTLFALGTTVAMAWGGIVWLVSAVLDRADGELARIGDMKSENGHRYDYYSDVLVNTAFFVAIGFGLRQGRLGDWSIPLGLIAGGALFLCMWWSELLERASGPGTRAYEGRWGFDPDDALMLMAPFAWFGWLEPILIGAAAVAPVVATVTGVRLLSMSG